jgi:4-hydroxy-3-polyprenylbenzoate decarboxylase
MMKLIIGMTGATGAPLAGAAQRRFEMPEVETHLVMSKWAKTTIELETPYSAREVAALADFRTARRTRPPSSHRVHFVPTA